MLIKDSFFTHQEDLQLSCQFDQHPLLLGSVVFYDYVPLNDFLQLFINVGDGCLLEQWFNDIVKDKNNLFFIIFFHVIG